MQKRRMCRKTSWGPERGGEQDLHHLGSGEWGYSSSATPTSLQMVVLFPQRHCFELYQRFDNCFLKMLVMVEDFAVLKNNKHYYKRKKPKKPPREIWVPVINMAMVLLLKWLSLLSCYNWPVFFSDMESETCCIETMNLT